MPVVRSPALEIVPAARYLAAMQLKRHPGLWALAGLTIVAVLVASLPSGAQPVDAWALMKRPGAIAIMRHAIAPGTGDPPNFTLGDCATQRNLDENGRRQARAIGDAFRAQEIEVDRVLASQWCRSRETAELLDLAPVEALPALNSFFRRRALSSERTEALRSFLADRPNEAKLVLVTHQVNITALTGEPVASGEIIVIDVASDGSVEVLGDILIRP